MNLRKSDLESLESAYKSLSERDQVDVPLDTWGASAPSIATIKQEVFRDLSPTVLGIDWWSGYSSLGTKRRILIADYLYQCCVGVERNLIEARLHLLSVVHFGDLVRAKSQGMVFARPDMTIGVKHSIKPSISDHIDDHIEDMHVAGFFRAIGSVVDCLSSVIVGVSGLPINIFTCGHGGLMKRRRDLEKKNTLHPVQQNLFRKIDEILGDDGWLDWSLAYRNMLVHRGRMVQMNLLDWSYVVDKSGNQLTDEKGLPTLKTNPVSLLPREPDLSEIEVLRNDLSGLLLTEDVEETILGVFDRSLSLTEEICVELCGIWRARRGNPSLIEQPVDQWPDADRKSKLTFAGFKPGKYSFSPKQLSTHPTQTRRLRAASLDGSRKDEWQSFD